jgi:peptide/nickel transport system permease protein
MTATFFSVVANKVSVSGGRNFLSALRLLRSDRMALSAAIWLLLIAVCLVAGQVGFGDATTTVNLGTRNIAPFDFSRVPLQWLGTDSLGRSVLARLCKASSSSLGVALTSVALSLSLGTALGILSGYFGGLLSRLILRASDIITSFPTLLLALIVLYIFGPNTVNLITVLAITRIPVYLRVAHAEVLEARHRLYVDAARALGASSARIMSTHILPSIAPTLLTLASLNIAMVMLLESGLSFLGLGIQPPSVSWGLMVAQGRAYLSSAWWLTCFPGLAIMLTTLSFNLLANWFRIVSDPQQRWRLQIVGEK